MTHAREIVEIRLGLYVTKEQVEQVEQISQQIQALLCPDPDHAPPCPVPWEIGTFTGDPDRYESLLIQGRIEHG